MGYWKQLDRPNNDICFQLANPKRRDNENIAEHKVRIENLMKEASVEIQELRIMLEVWMNKFLHLDCVPGKYPGYEIKVAGYNTDESATDNLSIKQLVDELEQWRVAFPKHSMDYSSGKIEHNREVEYSVATA